MIDATGEPSVLIRDAEVCGRRVDVEVVGPVIARIRPAGAVVAAELARAARVVDAAGGALIPGLHDHHIHLLALAAAGRSLVLGDSLSAIAQHAASRPGRGWMRVVGYHEVEHGPLDRLALDAIVSDRPVRVQHQTGALWVMNTPALEALGLPGDTDGRLFGADAALRGRVPDDPPDLAAVGRRLATYGVTGLTDATPSEDAGDVDALVAAAGSGALPQRVVVTGGAALAAEIPRRLTRAAVVAGPVKIVIGDHQLPTFDELVAAMLRARAAERAVAVHAVTRVALALAVAAWDEVGARPGDRVEHGGIVPPDLAEWLAAHAVVVVTQPSFIHDRGDRFVAEVDETDLEHLYPCGRLLAAGVGVAGSTDAPFGDADPWRAIAAAVERRTRRGTTVGASDRVPADRALAMFLGELHDPAGPPRRVVPAAAADLCLLQVPLGEALRAPSSLAVRSVICGGRIVVEPDE